MYGGKSGLMQATKDSKVRDSKDGEIPDSSQDGDSLVSKEGNRDSGDSRASKASGASKDNKEDGVNQDSKDNKEDGVNQDSKDSKVDGVNQDSKVSADSRAVSIHGASKEMPTNKCRGTNRSITPEDGTTLTTRDSSKTFSKSSRSMIRTSPATSKAYNFSTPTESCVFQWVWLLPPTSSKSSRPCNRVTATATAESTAWKCSTFSRECRVFRADR